MIYLFTSPTWTILLAGVSHTTITVPVGVSHTTIIVSGFKLLKASEFAMCWSDKSRRNHGAMAGIPNVNTENECQSKCHSNRHCNVFSYYNPGCRLYLKTQSISNFVWDLKINTKEACDAKCKANSDCGHSKFYPSGFCILYNRCTYFGGTGNHPRWITTYGRGDGTNQSFGC